MRQPEKMKEGIRSLEELVALGFTGHVFLCAHRDGKRWRNGVPFSIYQCRAQSLAKFGFNLSKPVPAEEATTVADFGVFMQRYGSRGMSLADSYEMEGQPDAQPRCDRCKVVGATKQCNRCGEWYCSWVCQKAARRQHRKVCNMVYDQRL